VIATEAIFWLVFRFHLVPRANQRRPAAPYRSPYHEHKHLLLRRIVQRICTDATAGGSRNTNDTAAAAEQQDRHTAGSCDKNSANETDTGERPFDPMECRHVFQEYLTSWFRAVPMDYKNDCKHRGGSSKTLPPATKSSSLLPPYCRRASPKMPRHGAHFNKAPAVVAAALSSSSESEAGSVCSTSSSDDDKPVESSSSTSSNKSIPWTIPGLYQAEMDDFLAWALFAKHMSDMTSSDCHELAKCYQELYETLHLTFASQPTHNNDDDDDLAWYKLVPRRLSLEDARPWHRPLAVYLLVAVLRHVVAAAILRGVGFCPVVSPSTGLQGWVRRGKTTRAATRTPNGSSSSNSSNPTTGLSFWHGPRRILRLFQRNMGPDVTSRQWDCDAPPPLPPHLTPLVFFHGIAPAGLLFYLPMLLFGIVTKDRPCILVENPNISCTLAFHALSEDETVRGVQELVEACCGQDSEAAHSLTVCGHSFGSCPISWLLHDPAFRPRIRLCVLMDPVTLLLSDPAVMTNFLYSREVSNIRVIASSELFTEYYLRRHFSWYNSELWLDEALSATPSASTLADTDHGKTREHRPLHAIVALSENDEIVDAPKVKRHADLFLERQARTQQGNRSNKTSESSGTEQPRSGRLRTVYWTGAKHASCVTDPRKWRDLKTAMLQSELELLRQGQQ
jgi:hypothetical protein